MKSFTLLYDGRDWNLKHSATTRMVARYQCRRTALRESMAHAHGNRAKLVLVPGNERVKAGDKLIGRA